MKKIYYTEQKKDLISYRVFNFWNSECCQFNLTGFVNISFCFQIFYEAHRPVKMCEHCGSFVICEAVEHCPNKIARHMSGKPTCKIRHINRVSLLLPVFFFLFFFLISQDACLEFFRYINSTHQKAFLEHEDRCSVKITLRAVMLRKRNCSVLVTLA